jgi:hypothetical protein
MKYELKKVKCRSDDIVRPADEGLLAASQVSHDDPVVSELTVMK